MAGQVWTGSARSALILSLLVLPNVALSQVEALAENTTLLEPSGGKLVTIRSLDGRSLFRVAAGVELIDYQNRDIQLPLILQDIFVRNDLRVLMFYYQMYALFDSGRLTFHVREDYYKKTYTIERIEGQFYPGDYTQVHCSSGHLNITYRTIFRYSCANPQTVACYAESSQKLVARIKFDRLEFELLNSDPNKGTNFTRPPYPGSCLQQQKILPTSAPRLGGGTQRTVASPDGKTIASAEVSGYIHDPNGRPDLSLSLQLTSLEVFPDLKREDGKHWLLSLNFDKGRLVLFINRDDNQFEITEVDALFLPREDKHLYCFVPTVDAAFPATRRYQCERQQVIPCHTRDGSELVAEINLNKLEFEIDNADPDKTSRGEFTHEPFENSCTLA